MKLMTTARRLYSTFFKGSTTNPEPAAPSFGDRWAEAAEKHRAELAVLLETTGFKQCEIQIVKVHPAEDPDLPSIYFPGCGDDRADFVLIGGDRPVNEEIIRAALESSIRDSYLVEYDVESQSGCFGIIDGAAPTVSTKLVLTIDGHF